MDAAPTMALAAIVAAWRIEHDGVPHEAGETFLVPADVAERLVASGAAAPGEMPAPTSSQASPPEGGQSDASAASANGAHGPALDQGDSPEAEAATADATANAGDGSDAVAGTDSTDGEPAEKPRRRRA